MASAVRWRVRSLLVLLVVAFVAVVPVVTAPTARAEEGLDLSSTTRYVLDADASAIRVTMTMTLRNTTPDSGGMYTYFNGYDVPIPSGATELRARSGDRTLSVSREALDEPGLELARVTFPRLLYGRSRTVVLNYVLPGQPPRSEDRTRVGPGYATFEVHGPGDPGRLKVEVVIPSGWVHDSSATTFTARSSGSTTTVTTTETNLGQGFWARFGARDPAVVAKGTDVTVGSTTVSLQPYPNDQVWRRFVTEKLTAGLPILEDYVGQPWPSVIRTIREDAGVTVRGYGGWFDPGAGEILLSEDLDTALLFHELAHGWSSEENLEGRWMYEGLAEVLAQRVVRDLGEEPASRSTVTPTSAGHLPLASWTASPKDRVQDVDEYAYPASYQVMAELLEGADDDEFTAIVRGIIGRESVYAAKKGELTAGWTTWTRLLDLVETRGGNPDAAAILSTWVLTPSDKALLAGRAPARASYASLDESDGSWRPPVGLRRAMTDWEWDVAAEIVDSLGSAPGAAATLQAVAEETGLPVPETVRSAYETAADASQYAALAGRLASTTSTLESVGRSVSAAAVGRNPLETVGAAVQGVDRAARSARTELANGDLVAADRAAEQVRTGLDRAAVIGAGIVIGGPVLLALIVIVAWVAIRRVLRS